MTVILHPATQTADVVKLVTRVGTLCRHQLDQGMDAARVVNGNAKFIT